MEISELIAEASKNQAETARMAGIARSTLLRINTGETNPTLSTLKEIALTQGMDIRLSIEKTADPSASHAARVLFDKHVKHASKEADEWLSRFERWGLKNAELLIKAGILSNPIGRHDARFFAWKPGVDLSLVAASAGDSSGGKWALSGVSSYEYWTGEKINGTVILWVEKAEESANALAQTLQETSVAEPVCVAVVPAKNIEFVDSVQYGVFKYTCPLQTALDCFGIGANPVALIKGWFNEE